MAAAPGAVRHWWMVRHAAPAIYGTIIGAAVMVASEEHTPVDEVAAAVIVTLIVYWLAERWSFLLGSHLTGEPITWRHARQVFAEGWAMVQASYLPLFVMLVSYFFGLDENNSVNLALGAALIELVTLGAAASRRSGLRGWALVGGSVFTGVLGLLLIFLKALVSH